MKTRLWRRMAVVLLVALVATCVIRIEPHEAGVRTNNIPLLGGKGIVQQDFGPGWHLAIPLVTSWTRMPAAIRRVELTRDPRQRSALGSDALMVQSSDGDRVLLDLHIFFRIQPGLAHEVLQDTGAGDAHVDVLKGLVNDRLRAIYGTLSTEQFYDSQARDAKTGQALAALNEVLAPRYLEVVDIAFQDLEFEPRYEQKIKDKKLADQNVELNKAQGRAAAEKAEVARIQARTKREVELIAAQSAAEVARVAAEAAKYAAERRAEADLSRERLRAEGTLAIARAEADVTREKTRALTGSGGANLAAKEAVGNLKVDTIAFPTSAGDWFDVREMAGRLGARP